MASVFENNFFNLGINLIPHFWRYRKTGEENDLVPLVRSTLSPVQELGDDLLALQEEIADFLNYNGQHTVLEEYLNDKYDDVLRGIYITENNIASQILIIDLYLDGEIDPSELSIYLDGESQPQPFSLYLDGESQDLFTFTINIPVAVVYDETTLRSQLTNYVVAGNNYNIVTF